MKNSVFEIVKEQIDIFLNGEVQIQENVIKTMNFHLIGIDKYEIPLFFIDKNYDKMK